MSYDDDRWADGLPIKKQFLTRAFYPYGPEACRALGLMPSSQDVAKWEADQAMHEVSSAAGSWSGFILSRVAWYLQANEALLSDHEEVAERTLEEHLAAFTMSVMIDERLAQ